MLRTAFEAAGASARLLAQPPPLDAFFGGGLRQRNSVLRLLNQSGCELRCHAAAPPPDSMGRIGRAAIVVVATGEQTQLAIELPPGGPLPLKLELRVGKRWCVLPPMPSRQSGSWTVLANPVETAKSDTAGMIGEPLPLRVTLGALAGSCTSGAAETFVWGGGMQLVVRSLMSVHNGTSEPLQLQLLLSDATLTSEPNHSVSLLKPHFQTRAECALRASGAQYAEGGRAAVPASLVAASYISELGMLLPGSSLFIPPHLSSARLRLRPVPSGAARQPSAPQAARTLSPSPQEQIPEDISAGHSCAASKGAAHQFISADGSVQPPGSPLVGMLTGGVQLVGPTSPLGTSTPVVAPMGDRPVGDRPVGAQAMDAPPSPCHAVPSASFSWPLEADAFWLGQCHHTPWQTRVLRQLITNPYPSYHLLRFVEPDRDPQH